ncbi:hypothetical protein SDD30_10445 [Moorella naiadis]|uniref:hypothetical protein n=1 Tax=Moorella naiadis (nom. illeg.) TaxID=3093670 RepID=UPI003D9C8614
MLQVQVTLKMKQPKCRARVELRPAPAEAYQMNYTGLEELRTLRKTLFKNPRLKEEFKEKLSWIEALLHFAEKNEGPIFWEYITWEDLGETVELGKQFTDEMVLLALKFVQDEWFRREKADDTPESRIRLLVQSNLARRELAEVVAEFCNRWGPLFKKKAASWLEIAQRLALLSWAALCWGYQPGQTPLPDDVLDRVLIVPLQRVQEAYNVLKNRERSQFYFGDSEFELMLQQKITALADREWKYMTVNYAGYFYFVPEVEEIPETEDFRIILRSKFPDWKKRDKVISWVRREVLANVKRTLNDVEYKSYVDAQGNLRLIGQPKDAFSLALLRIIWSGGGLRKCACGCGLHTFNKWYHPSHQRRGQVKQNVLAYWRTQKNRGRISGQEYELIKDEINRLWSEGIREKDKLKTEIEKFIAKKNYKGGSN